MDAYGHYTVARSLCSDPTNLAVHWVWLPLYHFLLAAFACSHPSFALARVGSALAALALPLMVLGYARDSPRVASGAAAMCALAALPNLLGVSAQQEALFSVLVLATAWAIDEDRPLFAGVSLACACLVRYEAWGALGLALAQPLAVHLARRLGRVSWLTAQRPLRAPTLLIPLGAIASWVLVHRWVDGTWFGFLRDLYHYTHVQREVLSRGPVMEALWFPVLIPLIALGPLPLIAPFGVTRALRRGWVVPIGVYAFLLVSYFGKGALGGERYYCSLVPFLLLCAAHAIERASSKRARAALWSLALVSVAAATAVAFFRLAGSVDARRQTLVAAEARMDSPTWPP